MAEYSQEYVPGVIDRFDGSWARPGDPDWDLLRVYKVVRWTGDPYFMDTALEYGDWILKNSVRTSTGAFQHGGDIGVRFEALGGAVDGHLNHRRMIPR